jgi:hypothetical protein
MLIMWVIQRHGFRRVLENPPGHARGKLLAALSLVVWAGAVTAGRLMAYVGKVG